jgi:hypothetical protein
MRGVVIWSGSRFRTRGAAFLALCFGESGPLPLPRIEWTRMNSRLLSAGPADYFSSAQYPALAFTRNLSPPFTSTLMLLYFPSDAPFFGI